MNLIRKHKLITSIIGVLIIVVIIVSIFVGVINSKEKALLDKYGLTGLSVEEKVLMLDSITSESEDFNASITGTKLKIKEGDFSFEYDVPEDKFYLSFAPYINKTHTCTIHNLRTCRAELKNQVFEVSLYDEDNNLLFTKQVKSFENGFIGMWLPSDIFGRLVVSYDGKEAETVISTFDNDNTCLTTLKLE